MKNLFLTGERRAGKSTAIKEYISHVKNNNPSLRIGGFFTESREREDGAGLDVVLVPACGGEAHTVGVRNRDGSFEGFPEKFDEFGPGCFMGDFDIIIADEVGFMETGAELFIEALTKALDGETPVLGVVKKSHAPVPDMIKARQDTRIIEVTDNNRNIIPDIISAHFADGPLCGLITAAGMSSRMGAFKPLLPVGGECMLGRVLAALKDAGTEKTVVVTGNRADELKEIIAKYGATEVYNPLYASTQMYDSIKLGLGALKGAGKIMLCPVDAPAISIDSYHAVASSEKVLARTQFDGKPGHPVLLDGGLIPYLMGYNGKMGMRGAMENSGFTIEDIVTSDPGVLMDADTPQAYEAMLKYFDDTHR